MKDTKQIEVNEIQSAAEAGLVDLAKDIVTTARDAVKAVGQKYVAMCEWIRTKQIDPKTVTRVLLEQGFPKTRASEVNRIAQVSDELWDKYKAGEVGRMRILELARGNDTEDVTGSGESEGEGEGESGGKSESAVDVEDIGKAKIVTMAKAAKTILNAAEFLNLRSKKWTIHNGYVLTLKKEPKAAAKKGDNGTENN